MRINELPEGESEAMLAFLFEHQLQDKFRYMHRWQVKDLLLWDNLGSIHQAIADYRPEEERLMLRCQVMATKVFQNEFLASARQYPMAAG